MTFTPTNSPVLDPLLKELSSLVYEYKEMDAKLSAARGDKEQAIQAWIESQNDGEVAKLKAAVDKAMKRINDLALAAVEKNSLSESDKDKLTVEWTTLKSKVNSAIGAISSIASNFDLDKDVVDKALEEIGNPTKSGRGRPKGTTGSSLPRASVNIKLSNSGAPDKEHVADGFSAAVKLMGSAYEVEMLQKAFADAAGVKHEDIKTVQKPVEFKVQAPGTNVIWTLKTTPKTTAKKGRKPKDQAELAA